MKRLLYVLLPICSIIIIITCIFFIKQLDNKKLDINLELSECETINEDDNYIGIHGDGEYILKTDCSKNNKNILKQVEKWKKLPLSENLQLIFYGGEKNNISYVYELAKKNNIPKINNGYYYFLDRYSDASNIHSDISLFDRHSFNFTIALYDLDTDILYYYEFDT